MKGSRPKVAVVGSLVMDLVFRAGHRPEPGETLLGEDFGMFLGGKGFNQAVGCKRLGAGVTLVGRIGRDLFGDMFIRKLEQEKMGTEFVMRDDETGTGVACPVVFSDGQNSIIGVPRANMRLSVTEVEAAESEIAQADMLMLQFEVNPDASKRAAEIARRHNTTVLLDPAPAHLGRSDFNWLVDYIVPNEIEADMLAQGNGSEESAKRLFSEDVRAVVVSLGEKGALVVDENGIREHPGYRVDVRDTTAAGDAFRAGLGVMLAQDKGIDQAVRFANACGALACTKMGAEPSMPTLSAVEQFRKKYKPQINTDGHG